MMAPVIAQDPPVNILLVDDQPAKLLSYETILAGLGENLIRANSGKEALEHLLKTDVAVVLVDVCMPELDGFELASMIRSHPRFKKTAIILVSAILVDDVDRLRGYDSGAVDYVSVPIIPEILRAKVSVFVELFRKSEQLKHLNRELEQRVAERTAEIAGTANRLRQSEERLRLVLTSAGIQGWTWNTARDEVSCVAPSGEPERLFGSLAEFVGLAHPGDQASLAQAFARAAASGDEFHAEFRMLADGEERWMLGRGTVIRDSTGLAQSIAGINIDITERKRAEQERGVLLRHAEEARREAEHANRLKDEFLATLSHELRTPLNAITGWAHLLSAGSLDEAGRSKAILTISRNAQLQSQLISDILDVSRIVTGKLRLEIEPISMVSVISAVLDTVKPAADAKSIEIETNLTDVVVQADGARLQQVVWNLLSNAIKFAPKQGRVRVLLRAAGAHVEVTVEDDGPGISPEFLPFIFDRFRQSDSSSTRPHHGLGLGLAIVRHLLEMHGGTIQAGNRQDGTGATFTLTLPKQSAYRSSERSGQMPAVDTAVVELDEAPSLAGLRILIIDDDADGREVVAAILKSHAAECTTTGSVAEAFQLLEQNQPDVVVADIEMPVEDGYAFIRKLRALPSERGGQIAALALTAYASTQDRMKVLKAGFQMHVPKPVQPAELVTVVASLGRKVSVIS
jgi:PAS domain S-box-containing protein